VVGGSAIVTNVRTGEILAMASYPDFDPNTSGALSKDDPRRTNNVTSSVYEPGSVFKVFTLATGIDTGLVNINSPIDARAPLMIGGRIVHDDEKDNSVLPLWEVFTHSSNIGAARLGMRLGPDEMQRYFRNFGLFNAAPSELKESARPLTPPRFNADSSAYMAFGQGIAITPLALATGMGAVLNGGDYVPLTIRKRDPGAGPVQGRRVISEATSRTMLYLMRLNAVQGTGAKADAAAPGYRLGGKTGSAQKEQGGHMSHTLVTSFASVFPTDGDFTQDRYFVLVMLDSPHGTPETHGLNEGAWNAAPTVGRVIERIAPILGVARVQTAGTAQAPKPPPTDAQLSAGEGQ